MTSSELPEPRNAAERLIKTAVNGQTVNPDDIFAVIFRDDEYTCSEGVHCENLIGMNAAYWKAARSHPTYHRLIAEGRIIDELN